MIQRNCVNKWTNNLTQQKPWMDFTDKNKVSESVRPSSLSWAKGTPIFLRFILGISCWSMSMSPALSCVVARRVRLTISIGQFARLAANGAVEPLSRIGFFRAHFGMSGWSLKSLSTPLSTWIFMFRAALILVVDRSKELGWNGTAQTISFVLSSSVVGSRM